VTAEDSVGSTTGSLQASPGAYAWYVLCRHSHLSLLLLL